MLVKGFVNIQSLLSNTAGVISPLGELSPMGYTYSRELGYYQSDEYPDYNLITMTCATDQGVLTSLNQTQVSHAIRVVNFIRTFIASRIPPYNVASIRNNAYDFFAGLIASLELGSLQSESIGTLPHWISWTNTTDQTKYHLWLSDIAFTNQYDEYEVVTVPPLVNIDDFFLATNIVANRVMMQPINKIMERVDDAKEGDPETYIRVMDFNFVDPVDSSITIKTYWPVIIYGDAGDNIDSIKDAIIDYILANSTRTRSQWEVIFPEIFRRTEFIIIPRWDQISIPNMLTQTGLYSSVIDPVESLEFVKARISFYTQQHIHNNTYLAPYPYKAIALSIVNGQFNIDGKKDFKALYKDYLPVPSTSLDFNRMTLATQEVMVSLNEMLLTAESMTRYSFVEKPMKRVFRGGKLYLTKLINNINFVMVPKSAIEV